MNKHTLPGFDSPVMMYQYYCLTFTYESLQQRQQRGQHNLPQFSSFAVVVLCHIIYTVFVFLAHVVCESLHQKE
jgi:ABC-type xylose transport system permease subunit